MALAILAWLVAIPVLGAMTGLRSMTPMAILCYFAYKHHLWLVGTWGFWAMKPAALLIFGVLAVLELIADKLPGTPNRTAPFPLIARIGFGGLAGALAATGLQGSAIEGIFLGALSAFAGTFLGFHLRHWLVKDQGFPAMAVALAEDCVAIGFSILAMGIITG
jgi:uncharacterized membrane protein